jgi:hypothetical protein
LKLIPILENDLLRVGGRLDNAKIPSDTKHQIIVPQHSAIAKIIVINAHSQVLHAGVEHTTAKVREKYWIPRIRVVVKLVIR